MAKCNRGHWGKSNNGKRIAICYRKLSEITLMENDPVKYKKSINGNLFLQQSRSRLVVRTFVSGRQFSDSVTSSPLLWTQNSPPGLKLVKNKWPTVTKQMAVHGGALKRKIASLLIRNNHQNIRKFQNYQAALSHVNIVIHCNLGIPYKRPYPYILRKNILWMIERIFHFGMTKEGVLVRFVIKSYYQICFYFHIHLYGSFSRPPPHHHSLKWVWTLLSRKFNLHVIMFSLVPSRGEHEDRRRPTQGNVLNFILRHIFPTFRFIIALWILA